MIKITITIEESSENKVKKDDTIKGKYIIARSNYSGAHIIGVPCKVVSEPFSRTYQCGIDKSQRICINVVSCITGIHYIIPYDTNWFTIYDTFTDILKVSKRFMNHGYSIYRNPEMNVDIGKQIMSKKYYPIDNSYTKLLSKYGDCLVAGEEVEIFSEPYIGTAPYNEKILFVNVRKNDGSIVKCMFMEHKLLP